MHHPKKVPTHRITSSGHRHGNRLALPISMAVALASLPGGLLAQPTAKPATLQEALAQIEALKKQMSELETFVREQARQQGVTTPAPAPAMAPGTAAAAPDSGFVKWNEFVTGKSRFKLYGFLRGDMIYDDSRPGGNTANSSLVPAFILSENGFGGAANLAPSRNHENIVFHPRLSRFGIDFTAPAIDALWGAKPGAKLEIDFYNLFPTGAESREYLRLRHAYASLKWDDLSLLAGQTTDVIAQFYPSVNPDFSMWGAGNVGDRRPQFRVEWTPKAGPGNVLVQGEVGLTGADDNRDLDSNGIRDGEASGVPTVQGRIGYRYPLWENQMFEMAGWVHYAREKIDSPAGVSPGFAAAGRTDFTSEGFGLDLSLPLYQDIVSLKGEVWTGKNLDDIRGGILQGINTTTAQQIRATGGWGELMARPQKWYSLHGGYLFDNPRDGDLPAQAPKLNSVWYLGGRLYFDPIEFGLDYLNWTTYFKDTVAGAQGKGQDNRFQAFMSYKF
jgi:hypothetical protein